MHLASLDNEMLLHCNPARTKTDRMFPYTWSAHSKMHSDVFCSHLNCKKCCHFCLQNQHSAKSSCMRRIDSNIYSNLGRSLLSNTHIPNSRVSLHSTIYKRKRSNTNYHFHQHNNRRLLTPLWLICLLVRGVARATLYYKVYYYAVSVGVQPANDYYLGAWWWLQTC